jgi:hypothetical protein
VKGTILNEALTSAPSMLKEHPYMTMLAGLGTLGLLGKITLQPVSVLI